MDSHNSHLKPLTPPSEEHYGNKNFNQGTQQHLNMTDAVNQAFEKSQQEARNTQSDFKGLSNPGNATTETDQSLTSFHNFFNDLFTWKFPRASGVVFAGSVSVILAVHYIDVLRYVLKGLYLSFAAVSTAEFAGKTLTGKGFVSQMRPQKYFAVPRESVESIFAGLHQFLNFLVLEFQRILFVENFATTVSAFVATFFSYFLIKYLPLWSLVLTSTILAFSVPLVYLKNQEVIDQQIAHLSEIINAQLNQAKEVGGKYANEYTAQAKQAAGNLTGKVQELTGAKKEQVKKPYRDETEPAVRESDFPSVPIAAPVTVPADVIEPEFQQAIPQTY
ncbi:hypothetical protein BJ508DRAFT_414400 [Ascobolus immersus RN42]|uniref:Reticulon-like protein n=1 Tax=Ascobolus immersus RN42 TaxID=1160509 RepID=A0A3N4I8X7_ASCIM|nr:hypothetical protein BJ508DRAFT_414400 [Ascobolus immersus RN42]